MNLRILVVGSVIALAGCTAAELSESTSLAADLAALLSTAESNGSVPSAIAADINTAISGIENLAVGTSGSIASGASTETTVVSSLQSAVTTVAADLPNNATVQSDSAQALQLLGEVDTSSTETATQQAEAAVGTFLVDYLAAKGPAGAAVGGAPSAYQSLITDARSHITKLRG